MTARAVITRRRWSFALIAWAVATGTAAAAAAILVAGGAS